MDSENDSSQEKKAGEGKREAKAEDVNSEATTADSRMLVLLVVLVILVLSNILTAYIALTDDDEDEHDDDNGHTNGDEPKTRTPVIEDISVKGAFDLIQAMKGNTSFTVIDVRTMEEYDDGHIRGALNFDIREDNFEPTIRILDRNLSYLVYCKSGGRSGQARDLMEIYHMLNGFERWKELGYEVEGEDS